MTVVEELRAVEFKVSWRATRSRPELTFHDLQGGSGATEGS